MSVESEIAASTNIGVRAPRVEGTDKVTGEASYAGDIVRPGMLWGRTLRAYHPHARIVSIDAEGARQLPGVRAVITGADIPLTHVGRMFRDMPLLARDVVRFIGDRVAAVAADSVDIAEEALGLIDVQYEELPAVFDPLEAMEPDAPVLHPDVQTYGYVPDPPPGWPIPHVVPDVPNGQSYVSWAKGDIDAGLASAELVVTNTFRTAPTHQAYIEPSVCTVQLDDGGRVHVWMTHKNPFPARAWLAQALGLAEDQVVFEFVRLGGDFGGKGDLRDAPIAYHLSKATGRPVRIGMEYAEEFSAASTRHGSVITLETGVDRDGTLVAHRARAIFDGGAYAAYKPRPEVHLVGPRHLGGGYRIPHSALEAYCIYTNHVPAGYMRAPGEPQVIFALESHMDVIASKLGLDPYEFRRKNLLTDDEVSAAGHAKSDLQFHAVLDTVIERSGWRDPKTEPNVGRGLAVSNQKLGTGFSLAFVLLFPDGHVAIRSGIPDAGVGAHTMLRQIAAEALTVPPDSIEILFGNTDESPWDMGLGASRHTYIHGQAVMRGVAGIIEQAKEAIASTRTSDASQLDLVDGEFVDRQTGDAWSFEDAARLLAPDEPLLVVGEYLHPGDEADTECFSAQVAEVEVDPQTGRLTVRNLTTCNDAGRVLNPLMAEGQVEGGVIQGFGFAVMEEIRINEGQVTNGHFGEYKIPTIADVPHLDRTLLEEVPGPGPFGARPIAEFAVAATAPAIANAVFDAVGVRVTDTPITAEKVFKLMRDRDRGEEGASR